jgi:hypothetical protein
LRLPSFEYHNELVTWRELLLHVRKDAIKVLLKNAGSLLLEKLKRIGQPSLPEDGNEDPMKLFYRLEKLPDLPLQSTLTHEGHDDHKTDGEEERENIDRQEKEKKITLLFGDLYKKKPNK